MRMRWIADILNKAISIITPKANKPLREPVLRMTILAPNIVRTRRRELHERNLRPVRGEGPTNKRKSRENVGGQIVGIGDGAIGEGKPVSPGGAEQERANHDHGTAEGDTAEHSFNIHSGNGGRAGNQKQQRKFNEEGILNNLEGAAWPKAEWRDGYHPEHKGEKQQGGRGTQGALNPTRGHHHQQRGYAEQVRHERADAGLEFDSTGSPC